MTEPKSAYDAILEQLDKPFKDRLAGLKNGLKDEALAKAEANIQVIEGFRGQLHKLVSNLTPIKDAINGAAENGLSRIAQDVFGPADKQRTAQEIVDHLKSEGFLEEVTQAGKTEKALHTSREWINSQYEAYSGLTSNDSIKAKLKEASAKHAGELDAEIKTLETGGSGIKAWTNRVKGELTLDNLKASFAESSTMGKAVKGTGAVISVGAIIDGTRRAVSKDENGERHVGIGGLEVIAGLGGGYLALFKKVGEAAVKQAATTAAHVR